MSRDGRCRGVGLAVVKVEEMKGGVETREQRERVVRSWKVDSFRFFCLTLRKHWALLRFYSSTQCAHDERSLCSRLISRCWGYKMELVRQRCSLRIMLPFSHSCFLLCLTLWNLCGLFGDNPLALPVAYWRAYTFNIWFLSHLCSNDFLATGEVKYLQGQPRNCDMYPVNMGLTVMNMSINWHVKTFHSPLPIKWNSGRVK